MMRRSRGGVVCTSWRDALTIAALVARSSGRRQSVRRFEGWAWMVREVEA